MNPESTTLTVTIELSLRHLKMAYARYIGEKDYRKIRKSDIEEWVSGLASADIDADLDKAIKEYNK